MRSLGTATGGRHVVPTRRDLGAPQVVTAAAVTCWISCAVAPGVSTYAACPAPSITWASPRQSPASAWTSCCRHRSSSEPRATITGSRYANGAGRYDAATSKQCKNAPAVTCVATELVSDAGAAEAR